MPNCFQLTRKTEPEKGPVSLNAIDAELCGVLGREVHPTAYCMGWFDYIGFKLAMGRSFEEIKAKIISSIAENQGAGKEAGDVEYYQDMLTLANYLDANFTSDSWAEIGKR